MEEEIIGNRWKELDYDGYCRECRRQGRSLAPIVGLSPTALMSDPCKG